MIEGKPLPPGTDPEPSLEQQIAAALVDETVSATELATLVSECENTIDKLEADWEAAFDIRRWPDPEEALAHRNACAFRSDRLRGLLSELKVRHREAAAAEYLSKWHADVDVLQAQRDALAAEWGTTYPNAVARLIDLITRTAALDEEISTLHRRRPAGVSRHLLNPELVARGITEFNRSTPSITKELRLPDWVNSAKTVWPLPRVLDVSTFAVPDNPNVGPSWSSPEVLAAREAAAQAENERRIGWHAEQERLQEERINREERERFAQRRS